MSAIFLLFSQLFKKIHTNYTDFFFFSLLHLCNKCLLHFQQSLNPLQRNGLKDIHAYKIR